MYCSFFAWPLAYTIWCFLWPKSSIRDTKEALFNGSYTHPLSNIHGSERSCSSVSKKHSRKLLSLEHY